MGKPAQEEALGKPLSALSTVRGFAIVRDMHNTVITATEMLVELELPDFPVVGISAGCYTILLAFCE